MQGWMAGASVNIQTPHYTLYRGHKGSNKLLFCFLMSYKSLYNSDFMWNLIPKVFRPAVRAVAIYILQTAVSNIR